MKIHVFKQAWIHEKKELTQKSTMCKNNITCFMEISDSNFENAQLNPQSEK